MGNNMSSIRRKKRKQSKPADAKPQNPARPICVRDPGLTIQDAKIIVAGLSELPFKIALPIINKMQAAITETLTVKRGDGNGSAA
jgi:hypothetical protein